MADVKKQVQDWLNAGRDYDEGLLLLVKHSPQKTLVNSLVNGNDNPNHIDKLLYELTILAGLGSEYTKRSSLIRSERKRIKKEKAQAKADRTPKEPENKNEGKSDKSKDLGKDDSKKDDIREVTEKTVIIVEANKAPVPFNKLPLIIQEVIKQKGNLYRERDQLHESLKLLPEDNKAVNIGARKPIVEKIAHISERIDFLYNLQKNFAEKNEVPGEIVLNWDPEPAKPKPKIVDHSKLSDIELKNRQTNLRVNITKTKNMLLFQKTSKQEKENPLPDGPKKEKYKTKLEKLTFELDEIGKEIGKRK